LLSDKRASSITPARRRARPCERKGYEVVLVNSNPATIMTDPEIAQRTYIEPLTKEYLEEIIARERPDALCRRWAGKRR